MDLRKIKEEKNILINILNNCDEYILTDYGLQLLIFDIGDKTNEGTFEDKIWLDIYRNIASRDKEEYQILDYNLKKAELLVMELGESVKEVEESIKRYNKIIELSKNTIGVKLDKEEIQNLLSIVKRYKPTMEENDELYDSLTKEENNEIISFKR